MITADHGSAVMQEIKNDRIRQLCQRLETLRSPWLTGKSSLTGEVGRA